MTENQHHLARVQFSICVSVFNPGAAFFLSYAPLFHSSCLSDSFPLPHTTPTIVFRPCPGRFPLSGRESALSRQSFSSQISFHRLKMYVSSDYFPSSNIFLKNSLRCSIFLPSTPQKIDFRPYPLLPSRFEIIQKKRSKQSNRVFSATLMFVPSSTKSKLHPRPFADPAALAGIKFVSLLPN